MLKWLCSIYADKKFLNAPIHPAMELKNVFCIYPSKVHISNTKSAITSLQKVERLSFLQEAALQILYYQLQLIPTKAAWQSYSLHTIAGYKR
jgi:hypothetical protein